MNPQPGSVAAPSSASQAPWWTHILIGTIAIATGFGLLVFGYFAGSMGLELSGSTLVGSGVTFLGVGAGVVASA